MFASKNSTNLSLVDNIKNQRFLIYPDFIFFVKKYKISYHLLYKKLHQHIFELEIAHNKVNFLNT
jgi:hypothetical protein